MQHKLLTYTPSPVVDEAYASEKQPLLSSPEPTTGTGSPDAEGETMLLSQAKGKVMTEALDLPQLEVELERAIWQVENAMQKQNAELTKKEAGGTGMKPDDQEEKKTR